MLGAEDVRRRVRARLDEQRVLVRSLLQQRELLQGSVFTRYGQCGKDTCACRQGRKHGPYYVLSTRSGGRGAFSYLEGQRLREARALAERYCSFRKGMRRLKRLNLELVDLLRRYQDVVTRKGGRRLGIGPQP
jgi:hypothetical protein